MYNCTFPLLIVYGITIVFVYFVKHVKVKLRCHGGNFFFVSNFVSRCRNNVRYCEYMCMLIRIYFLVLIYIKYLILYLLIHLNEHNYFLRFKLIAHVIQFLVDYIIYRYGSDLVTVESYGENNLTASLAAVSTIDRRFANHYWLGLASLDDLKTNTLESAAGTLVSQYSGEYINFIALRVSYWFQIRLLTFKRFPCFIRSQECAFQIT